MKKVRLAILASGSGTNAENLSVYFENHQLIEVACIASNKPNAGVLDRAQKLSIPTVIFTKSELENGSLISRLVDFEIDFVILAGFLLKIPSDFIAAFPNRIINIHPSLLPEFGGKGMYGDRVHAAVLESKKEKSGITIHLVNENYDEGKILLQETCPVMTDDTSETLANRIHKLEYKYFPTCVEEYIAGYFSKAQKL